MLQTLAGAPLDTDAERAFLQRRLAFFAKMFAILVGGFHVMANIIRIRAQRELEGAMGNRLFWIQLVLIAGFVAIYLRTRTGSRSQRELRLFDALLALMPPVGLIVALNSISPHLRPELLLLLVVAHGIMARAVVVPSSALRTLVLSSCACLPVNVWTYIFYTQHADPSLPAVWLYLVVTLAWSVASTGISTVISYTIFGLRQKVVAASQIGQYVLERKIGQGGMGVVYRARHGLLRRPTAIKLLASGHADEQDLRRFEREVQLTSRLTHPNTIAIFDYGRTPEGVFYYAMEYLDGLDLQRLVECAGPQPASCVVRLLEQVAGALSEAHGLGLIHRDVKPANVILCERGGMPGFAKVVDFGLVKSLQNDAVSAAALSGTQTIIGTPLYLPPEQITHPEAVDARSDLYALGAVAYFLLTGVPLFEGASIVEICGHHLYTQPIPPSARSGLDIPNDLEQLVLDLLAKDPAHRPASARELIQRLAALQVHAFSEQELARWWARVLERRADASANGRMQSSPASAQTVAVDLRSRVHPQA